MAKINYSNRINIMKWRHSQVYKLLFDFEVKLHGNDQLKAIRCIKQKLGTTSHAFALMDYKDPPTFITKCAITFLSLGKYLEYFKIITPAMKIIFFMLDLIKDISLIVFITTPLFNEGAENKTTAYDDWIWSTIISRLF